MMLVRWYISIFMYLSCCYLSSQAMTFDFFFFFFFNDTATTEIYTRSLVGSVRCV